ncbi:MAG: hypothetical protein HY720_26130 [Planctomycetes bacterium]|nr:hypothetical protein [Planctomycetota bacterium]
MFAAKLIGTSGSSCSSGPLARIARAFGDLAARAPVLLGRPREFHSYEEKEAYRLRVEELRASGIERPF